MTHDKFLDAVQDRAEIDDRDQAARLVEVVLETFSEILYRTERDALSAPLPKELAHALHAAQTENTRRQTERSTPEEFLNRVQARSEIGYPKAREVVPIVISVLQETAGDHTLKELSHSLPNAYGAIFPFMEPPEGPPPA